MKLTSLRKFILFLPGVAALALSPVHAGEGGAVKWHKPVWKQKTGKGYQMCDALFQELKRYNKLQISQPWGTTICANRVIIPNSTLFKEPPWKKLDAQQYRSLLSKIFARGFYVPDDGKKKLTPEEETMIEKWVEEFIAAGGYLRTWTMPFPSWMESEANRYKMPVTPLTYIQTVRPVSKEENDTFITSVCRGHNLPLPKTYMGGVRLVNAQLTGPDPRLIHYPFSSPKSEYIPFFATQLRYTLDTRIYLYKDIPYFFSKTGMDAFSIQKKEWTSQYAYCDIY